LALGTAGFGLHHDGVADDGRAALGASERRLAALALLVWLCTAVVVPLVPP
jgi:hypothetical protein